jgi:hypothetical protein
MGRRGLTKVLESGIQRGFRQPRRIGVLLWQQSRFLWLLAQKDVFLARFSELNADFEASSRNFRPKNTQTRPSRLNPAGPLM